MEKDIQLARTAANELEIQLPSAAVADEMLTRAGRAWLCPSRPRRPPRSPRDLRVRPAMERTKGND
jgi:hypothetical protein